MRRSTHPIRTKKPVESSFPFRGQEKVLDVFAEPTPTLAASPGSDHGGRRYLMIYWLVQCRAVHCGDSDTPITVVRGDDGGAEGLGRDGWSGAPQGHIGVSWLAWCRLDGVMRRPFMAYPYARSFVHVPYPPVTMTPTTYVERHPHSDSEAWLIASPDVSCAGITGVVLSPLLVVQSCSSPRYCTREKLCFAA